MFEKIEQWKEDYIIVKHIFLDFKDYPNIKIGFPIGMFLILAAISLCIAVFIINKRKATVSLVARSLLRYEALSPESAKTLSSLHLDDKSIKSSLMRGGVIPVLLTRADFKKPSFHEYQKMSREERKSTDKIDFEKERFYLNPKNRELAETIAGGEEGSMLKTIILAVAILAIFAILFIVMPDLLELVNTWLAE